MSPTEKVVLVVVAIFIVSAVAGVFLGPFFGFNQLPKEGDDTGESNG